MRRHQHDDDDAFDERGILKDGKSVRVPLFMKDGLTPVQRAVAQSSMRVTDGQGGVTGLHRPGFRIDASMRTTALDAAYRAHERYLNNAYKLGDAKRTTHHYDPKGKLRGYSETEIEEEKDKAKNKDHHQQMSSIYDELDQQLQEAWRR